MTLAWIENKDSLAKVRLTADETDACTTKGRIQYMEICQMPGCGCVIIVVEVPGGGKVKLNPQGAPHLNSCPGMKKAASR
jgi:hypothetical protein